MIVGLNFTKFLVQRQPNAQGKISVSNNVDISNVTEHDSSLTDDQQSTLSFQFLFTVDYTPKAGNIALQGELLYLTSKQEAKAILNTWKTKKKVPSNVSIPLLNALLNKCNIKALELSQELNLPPHIPLPTVDFNKKTIAETYIG